MMTIFMRKRKLARLLDRIIYTKCHTYEYINVATYGLVDLPTVTTSTDMTDPRTFSKWFQIQVGA